MSQDKITDKQTLRLGKRKSDTSQTPKANSENTKSKPTVAQKKAYQAKPGQKPSTKNPTQKRRASTKEATNDKKRPGKHYAGKAKASKKITKGGLHPRNQHSGRYDFSVLVKALPELELHVVKNPAGESTINFSDPMAVKILNKALLAHHYGVQHWELPEGYLCPPIPGRADYIHSVADLLNSECSDTGYDHKRVKAFDVGVGANCIYPIIGTTEYGWKWTGSDVDPISVKTANFIAQHNSVLKGKIRCKLQVNVEHIFEGMISKGERYDVTTCNPPFHSSLEEAQKGTQRKLDNLAANRAKKSGIKLTQTNNQGKAAKANQPAQPDLNFGGQKAELWCPGGEAQFIAKMARESKTYAKQVLWFTTLVSKKENLPAIRQQLDKLAVKQVKVVEMSQGQKISRFIAWSFMDSNQRKTWIEMK